MVPSRRRWFVLSLRGLMGFILIFGVWLGWRVNRANTQRRAVALVQKAGGKLLYDDQIKNGVPLIKKGAKPAKPWVPGWLKRSIGEEYFREVTFMWFQPNSTEQVLVNDEIMAAIEQFDHLESLNFMQATVNDDLLAHVKGLTTLRQLQVEFSPGVTDRGLAYLHGLTKLDSLNLRDTRITDAGLEHLRGMKKLTFLRVTGTAVSDEGLARLQANLPTLVQVMGGKRRPPPRANTNPSPK